jgi:hypothetical protein
MAVEGEQRDKKVLGKVMGDNRECIWDRWVECRKDIFDWRQDVSDIHWILRTIQEYHEEEGTKDNLCRYYFEYTFTDYQLLQDDR